ncbi:hypothetical protein MNBD_GAMMA06-1113 [hydrothermal vent metagenome]|uniref:Uncharacterized protein n=1 Tax=hydrothermal vent metagenome TaxID=652676 RepID=A0A3B0WQ22_9ZZZZ
MHYFPYKLGRNRSLAAKFFLILILTNFASASIAEEPAIAYVDSVHQWGAWALDIEPAAGGLAQVTTSPLNTRDSKITLRTNSITALAPSIPIAPPVVPPITPPTIPVIPPVAPVTPPIGGPTDGLF